MGNESGLNNETGEKNVFIGNQAGFDELGSNKLIISNDSLSGQLIYGEFDNRILRIGGSVQIGEDSLANYISTDKGLLRWSDTLDFIQVFDGTQWKDLSSTQSSTHPWEENEFNFLKKKTIFMVKLN